MDRQDNNSSPGAAPGGHGEDEEDYNFFNHELSSAGPETAGPNVHPDADQTDIGDEIHLVIPSIFKI